MYSDAGFIFHVIDFDKLHWFHLLHDAELTNAVALVDGGWADRQGGKAPNVIFATVRIVDNQCCYPTSFLSGCSYALPLRKLGVHILS